MLTVTVVECNFLSVLPAATQKSTKNMDFYLCSDMFWVKMVRFEQRTLFRGLLLGNGMVMKGIVHPKCL